MKFWALLSFVALCQAKPNILPDAPSHVYSAPNVSPPHEPNPISPLPNNYVPPQHQQSFQGSFPSSVQEQPQQQFQFPSPTEGQDQGFSFPEQPQQFYQAPLGPGPQGPGPQGPGPEEPAPGPVDCPEGQVDKGDGTCATPQITRNLFLYRVPDEEAARGASAVLPDPKVHYNFVFIKTADQAGGPQPLVAPAPQQKTLVYVLNKKQEAQDQQVIQQKSKPTRPEVYFVSYKDGQNLDLPGGVDLQTALSQSLLQGEVVENPGDIDFTGTEDIFTPTPQGYNYKSP
ncbi:protein of unknown function DUF243 [Trinorchestia longiramus]|nr:protein of unknown function DUF243 [Trinorchestia longiramus]